MKLSRLSIITAACLCAALSSFGKDVVFSGPQIGERTTAFKAIQLAGAAKGQEIDVVSENNGAATALVFIHGIERSMAPLMRVIDEYGVTQKESLKTEFVFLSGDRLEAERRIPAVANSLRLQARVSLSLDGIEGPGNYGLNKECLMTVIAAKENRVTANFALVQPGIADAPGIIEALSKVCGDQKPPDVAQLDARRNASPEGMARRRSPPDTPQEKFPGAVPTDEKLLGLMRQFIRPTNDDRAIDALLMEIEKYITGNKDLEKQAVDGWTRILHFEDRYGTAYARKAGKAFLDRLQAKR